MTNEQKVEAYKMLLDGNSMQVVADKFGVTRQRIQQIFPGTGKRGAGRYYVYPNLKRWLYDNNTSASKLGEKIGASSGMVSNWMLGKNDPHKFFIDRILEVTGLTYEVAFSRVEIDETCELSKLLETARNELCQNCGKYKQAHLGACDGCRWRDM